MKKFLKRVSPIDSLSELEHRSSMELDANKVKSLMNAKDYPEALTKLYRIISKQILVWSLIILKRYFGIDAAQIHRIRDPIIP